MPTPEELEKKKKREAELWWKKVLAYYMMENYVTKAQAEAEESFRSAYHATSQYIEGNSLVSRLFAKEGDKPSAAEILMDIGRDEPTDSPLGKLYAEMQKQPRSEEMIARALGRVIVEEPPRMVDAAHEETKRRAKWKQAHEKEAEAADGFEIVDAEQVRYEEKLSKKMAFFRTIMDPEVYKALEQQMVEAHKLTPKMLREAEMELKEERKAQHKAGQIEEQEKEKEKEQEKERKKNSEKKRDYKDYMKEKRVDPKEKAGKLANAGDVYSAAAYMLAAWEQKDEKEFDEEKADARAMQLSGSRAFKAYMKGHPGNLLEAARGNAVEETHNGVKALADDLERRDAILTQTRDNLKKMATGKTPAFHKMLNALDRFVNEDTEPSMEEKKSLVNALADYILTDCSPQSREMNRDCFTNAMCSVKALIPEEQFEKVVEQVNVDRNPKVKAADFELDPAALQKKAPEPVKEQNIVRVMTRSGHEG